VVIGMLAVPVVDRLVAWRVPRPLAAMTFIAGLVTLIVAVAAVVVSEVIQQGLEIRLVVSAGLDEIDGWVSDGSTTSDAARDVDRAVDMGRPLLTGAASWATTIFSSALTFALGTFLALFILYYVLTDWTSVRNWTARHLGVSTDVGAGIVDDATSVVRNGFAALTVTSLVTTGLIALTVVILGVPLAVAITFVTFVGSYVPYLGAILSGAFAFLVALGASGPRDALILLVVILIVQNVVQAIVGNRMASDRLQLHPLPSIISSVCGVAIAGVLGAILSAPALALGLAVTRRLRALKVAPNAADVDDGVDVHSPTSAR
jgi:predicted PurR-regulated permease PerM